MVVEMLNAIFYQVVLPNSTAGALFVLFILLFRKITHRLSKGYVRILWILLLVELLAPPLFHGSFITIRNVAMNTQIVQDNNRTAEAGRQGDADTFGLQDAMRTADGKSVNGLQNTGGQSMLGSGSGGSQDGFGTLANNSELLASDGGKLSGYGSTRTGGGYLGKALPLFGAVAAIVWFVGVLILCMIYICQYLKLRKQVFDAVFLSEDKCWVTKNVKTPFVMPRIQPRVYLPAGVSGSKRLDILAHERQHLKNFDPLVKCVAAFATAVHWFNPFVWAAYTLIGKDLEMYCDECVLRGSSIEERKRYSNTLLEFASESGGLTLMLHFGESNTESRIRHILFVKKPRTMVSALLVALVAICGIFFLTSKNTEGKAEEAGRHFGEDTQEILAGKIQSQTDEPMLRQFYADYDGDGLLELYAVTGQDPAQGAGQIWFASAETVECLMDSEAGYTVFYDEGNVYEVGDGQKLFAINCGTMGSVYFSKCFFVQSGKAYEANIKESILEQDVGEDFKAYLDAYDRMYIDGSMSGHTRKAYYLKWTGKEFEEYPAKEIEVEELRAYDGAEEVLSQIEELDYEVDKVYLRSNEIININVVQDFDTGTIYENITLKISGNQVSVVETNSGGTDLISRASYGGIYLATGFEEAKTRQEAEDSSRQEAEEISSGQEAEDGSSGQEAEEESSGQEIDERKLFAGKVLRLIRQEDKRAFAGLVSYPIRVDLGGTQVNLKSADEFVENYDQIVNEEWKARVLALKADDVASNYLGTWMGNGEIWFEFPDSGEGRIFAINNKQGEVRSEVSGLQKESTQEVSTQEAWQALAVSKGMTLEEAQAWYHRFIADELYVDMYNYKITGCEYKDFDQDGTNDLFLVTSLSPREIYPEYLEWTAYVYGYINGTLVYTKGLAAFSQDGFEQFYVLQKEDRSFCTIYYTVDTDSLDETTCLLDLNIDGKVILETALPAQVKDMQALKDTMSDFSKAYFTGNTDVARAYLARSYEGEIDIYDQPEDAGKIEVQGIKGTNHKLEENKQEECTLSLEFRRSGEDSFTYLTVGFIREDGNWKVAYYGLEK